MAFDFFDLSSSNLAQESSVELWDNLNKVRGLPHNALHFPNLFVTLLGVIINSAALPFQRPKCEQKSTNLQIYTPLHKLNPRFMMAFLPSNH